MDERTFVEGSRSAWARLGIAVERARRVGITNLSAQDIKRMHEDYRRCAADLAFAQTHFPGSETTAYLNRLVGLAHGELYAQPPRRLARLWDSVSVGYPRLVRAHWRMVALAAAILITAAGLGALIAILDRPFALSLLPEMYRDAIGDRLAAGAPDATVASSIAPLLSSAIMANNIQVSFMVFAGGMTFGALTTYALIQNGILLGALAGLFGASGAGLLFWSLIVPHGALELPAIVLAAASGLMLARALIAPGDLTRAAALRRTSGDAVRLALGAVPLLVIAGLIEGFLTPQEVAPWVKIAFGALVGLLFVAYVTFAGRKHADEAGSVVQSNARAFTSR